MRNCFKIYKTAKTLVDELIEMHVETAIDLNAWPTAKQLVRLFGRSIPAQKIF